MGLHSAGRRMRPLSRPYSGLPTLRPQPAMELKSIPSETAPQTLTAGTQRVLYTSRVRAVSEKIYSVFTYTCVLGHSVKRSTVKEVWKPLEGLPWWSTS